MSCKELTDRLREEMEDGGRRMRSSARAQHDAAVMPKLVRLIEEIALFLRIASMLLLLAVAQASDALLCLPQNHHRLSAQTLLYAAAGPSERNSPRDIRLHQRVVRDGGSSLHRVEKVAVVPEHGEHNACSGGATIVAVLLLQIAGAQLRSACHVIL
jgi:hypothetical protein